MFRRLRTFLEPLKRFVTKKTLVGTDKFGNKYVLFQPDSSKPPRRIVETHDGFYDRDSIHKLWFMWLNNSRDDPPTETDIKVFDAEQVAMKERIRQVEEEDAKKRLQEQMERGMNQGTASASDSVSLEGMFEAMNSADAPRNTREGGATSSGSEKFQPEGWNPNKK
ncbi:hypothetical protein AAMO2058_000423300 [Amorphochlora amoebiformis]|uniref:NADH dehydrogenase [ubiquinone] 1 alpha subcomplex subunit 12 n=1 Tax=Amorphochlora amoebiformis TaxID=1561963 RepID=A0A7S0GQW2_9EUKA|mmetsp:Transcript_12023/g.19114  ORF Transcript_12023/g.19114 Transcript_12023/m.19114 type:complete len:166 (+) Transcript_12023:55-552(+)